VPKTDLVKKKELPKKKDEAVEGTLSMAPTESPVLKSPLNKNKENSVITLPISLSLHRKLKIKAQQEGVSIEDFVGELLAEGLVLRAWEIMERKNAMRTGQSSSGNAFPSGRTPNNNRNFRTPGTNPNFNRTRPVSGNSASGHHGGSLGPNPQMNNSANNRRAAYNNIFEDSANFLEYVRSQEKKQQR
jgi:hypothetical protein